MEKDKIKEMKKGLFHFGLHNVSYSQDSAANESPGCLMILVKKGDRL